MSLTSLATKVRPASGPDEAWNDAFNAGREAVLNAARTTRNPLAGLLTAEERQVVVALFNAAYDGATFNVDKNRITQIAHKLGLQNDG